MKISVITITFNSEKTIKDTVLSLENQTYKNIEYIVIDGNSTDTTLEIIKNSCTRVTKLVSEKDDGIYHALNKGIQIATGDYVGFLHSDDIFASCHSVANIVNTLNQNDADAVYGDLQYISSLDSEKVVRTWRSGAFNKSLLARGWMPPHPTFYMKRSLYQKYGGFDLSFRIAGDYDSLLRYLYTHNVSVDYCPEVLVKMKVGGVSNRNFLSMLTKSKEDIRAMRNAGISVPFSLFMKNVSKIPQFFIKK